MTKKPKIEFLLIVSLFLNVALAFLSLIMGDMSQFEFLVLFSLFVIVLNIGGSE